MIPRLHLVVAEPLEEEVRWEDFVVKYLQPIAIKIQLSQSIRDLRDRSTAQIDGVIVYVSHDFVGAITCASLLLINVHLQSV